MKIESAEFVSSANGAGDLPSDGLPELAMVGRSNVGKSTLINALLKQPIARTSATPGKTRLVNLYRVVTGPTGPFYLVDLPGYGYVRGPKESRDEFERLARIYFARAGTDRSQSESPPLDLGSGRPEQRRRAEVRKSECRTRRLPDSRTPGLPDGSARDSATGGGEVAIGVVMLVDARHPGLESDIGTHRWLRVHGFNPLVVVTKLDKLSKSERAGSLNTCGDLLQGPVLGVSARTGEGLEDLWKRMTSWITSAPANPPRRSRP